jgi:glycosyltransferase involved in cell wall biosynthesis
MSIALIVPSYGHFDYVLGTVNSFFEHSPADSLCYVIDDCSKQWPTDEEMIDWPRHKLVPLSGDNVELFNTGRNDCKLLVCRYLRHGGLTRSWNLGLALAGKSMWSAEYAICGNSDILFTPNWYVPLTEALKTHDLVGPVTNAAGRVFEQRVNKFISPYVVNDDEEELKRVSEVLSRDHQGKVIDHYRINGFFMMAKTRTWWENAYDGGHVFKPKADMGTVAYELQARFRNRGRKIGIVPSSFIFHYRSVSRGKIGLKGACGRGHARKKR